MFFGIDVVKSILDTNTVHTVLDIGCGKGYYSLFCASYGAQVDAIDPGTLTNYAFPKHLKQHPLIHFSSIGIQDFRTDKKYDLIICFNVIMFLKKKYVCSELLAFINNHLSPGGSCVLSYFDQDDVALLDKADFMISDFTQIPELQLINHIQHTFEENHPPLGLHAHYVHLLHLKKSK